MAARRTSTRTSCAILIALLLAVTTALVGGTSGQLAGAASTTTYTGTQTIPVPPESSYSGSAGGDGWAVALSSTEVFNVFHHDSSLVVACHLQSDASEC